MKKRKLTIALPCRQNYEAMATATGAKHCLSCSKDVIDFSRMSDAEIISKLCNAGGNICSRLRDDQLNRPLKQEAGRKLFLPKIIFGSILSLSFITANSLASNQAIDLTGKTWHDISNENEEHKGQLPRPGDKKPRVVSGKVLDKDDKQPLIGALISIKGTTINCVTNVDGSYKLTIPASYQNRVIRLVIKSIGYQDIEIKLRAAKFPLEKDVEIKMEGMILGEIAVVEY